jgi:hypothetical protein
MYYQNNLSYNARFLCNKLFFGNHFQEDVFLLIKLYFFNFCFKMAFKRALLYAQGNDAHESLLYEKQDTLASV